MESLHKEGRGQFYSLVEKYAEVSAQKKKELRDELFNEALLSDVKSSKNHPWKDQIKQRPKRTKLKIHIDDQRLPERNIGSNKP